MAVEGQRQDRIKASAIVAGVHALIGYVLVTGLGARAVHDIQDNLKIFNVTEQPPPPPEEEPPAAKSVEDAGAASAPNLKALPTPVVAPPPKIRIKVPPRIIAAPVANPLGIDSSAGAADVAGPGYGSGGEGSGSGSGGGGNGFGGGISVHAQRIRGRLENSDYPRSALRAGIEGSVAVRYKVEVDGEVSGCVVIRSSGNDELDDTTCALIERRFYYRPARTSSGEPVAEIVSKTYDWFLPARNDRGY